MKKIDNLKDIVDSNLGELDMSCEAKERLRERVKGKRSIFRFSTSKYIATSAVALIVAFIMFFNNFFGNNVAEVYAMNLMRDISPQKIDSIDLSDNFIKSTADFSVDLFKQTFSKEENTLISPTSVYLALGMTANGADGNTLKEFEKVLGRYGLDINKLNEYYYSLRQQLGNTKTEKMTIANSIWFRDEGFNVNKHFLQTNADYYGASAYKADFNSDKTIDDINNWVKENTGNLIDKIIEDIDPNTVMYIINALYFEGEWAKEYEGSNISQGSFKLENGTVAQTEYMRSTESIYLKDDNTEGFLKPYKGEKYSFMALLPKTGINIDSYVSSLTGEDFIRLMNSKVNDSISVSLPKFKAEYTKELKNPLMKMGLKDSFDSAADFSRMEDPGTKNLFINSVLHKTFIQVDEAGTKAGAATKVEVYRKSANIVNRSIMLDRPFLYAIIDNQTNLPIFLGVMNNPAK